MIKNPVDKIAAQGSDKTTTQTAAEQRKQARQQRQTNRRNKDKSAEQSAPKAGTLSAVYQIVKPFDTRTAHSCLPGCLNFLFSSQPDLLCPTADKEPERSEYVPVRDNEGHSNRCDAK